MFELIELFLLIGAAACSVLAMSIAIRERRKRNKTNEDGK